jgi:toxin-antitoxin system PIN domain toxin
MTSYLIDINVWLAMTWDLHTQHEAATGWFESVDDAALLFCRFTMLGLLRLLTNRNVMGDSLVTVREALKLYDQWGEDPRVTLVPEPRGMEQLFRHALAPFSRQSATKAIADCYLVGFAEAIDAGLVTFDRGLAGMANARTVSCTLIPPKVNSRKKQLSSDRLTPFVPGQAASDLPPRAKDRK